MLQYIHILNTKISKVDRENQFAEAHLRQQSYHLYSQHTTTNRICILKYTHPKTYHIQCIKSINFAPG